MTTETDPKRLSQSADTVVERPRTGDSAQPSTAEIRPSKPQVVDLPELVTVESENYVIGAEIAHGGMGRILTARDRRLGRDVAVKELLVETPELARRFEREARITARLQHPSIVSVHEAGRWPSGKPFYAMKLVTGRSLHYVIHKCKTLDERIALVPNILAVADAMAYAHSQRIIHRDLKPGNVLVGEFGETVVIDWGIAKSVDDPETPSTPISAPGDVGDQTVVGSVLGTPGYMPPEQARGEAVDERADVYAIGVMLYHALVGKTPFSGERLEIEAAMRRGAPPIAKVAPAVPADLIAIVERAMNDDLNVRYADARALADDLRRFQTGQLVGAHRYSTRQLIARWIRRHRTAVIVTAIAAVAIVVIGGVSLRSVVRARRIAEDQRVVAEKRGADAEASMGFMLFSLADQLRESGRLELMDTVVRRAVEYYDRVDIADVDPTRLVTALAVIGEVLREEGDLTSARRQYQRARDIAESHASEGPIWRHHVVTAYNNLGEAAYLQGDLPAALVHHRKALALAQALVAAEPNERKWQRDLATSERLVGQVVEDQGDVDGALASYRASFAIRKQLADTAPSDPVAQRDLMIGHTDLGLALDRARDAPLAMVELRAALDIAERNVTADPHNAPWQRDLAAAHERIGRLLAQRGDTAGALAEYQHELATMSRLAAIDSANLDWQRRLSVAHELVGVMLVETGDPATALDELRASQQIRLDLTARDPTNMRWKRDVGVVTTRIGDALLAKGDAAGALAAYRDGLLLRDALAAKDPTSLKSQADLFSSHRRIGNALVVIGDAEAALVDYDAAVALAKDIVARDPSALDDGDLVDLHDKLADLMIARHDRTRAVTELGIAIDFAEKRAAHDPTSTKRAAVVTKLRAKLHATM